MKLKPCRHKIIDCPDCLKECIEEVLYNTVAGGNGGYFTQFGPVLFSKMLELTGFDINNRKINHSIIKKQNHK